MVERRTRNCENLGSKPVMAGFHCVRELLTLILTQNKNKHHYEVRR